VQRLRQNFLAEFPFRAEVEPGSSIYDLARVMFPDRFVMLKEHFRCVEPVIRFSMQFYNQELVPLRVPRASERLDPPLIDIFVEGGERRGNPSDLKAKVIQHFAQPMPNTVNPSADLIQNCQSDFERAVFRELVERGYRVIPQVGSQGFSIDMVVEGDGGRRLAIECDGDQYHGPDRWADDMNRQRILERMGWTFVIIR
jgi:very-short-patch-repair endonuclease